MQVRVENLRKEYATPSEPLVVLDDVCLSLESGESVAVTGPSGCGKSTLLHLLGTLETPTGGRIDLGGVDPFFLPDRELAAFRNKNIGFVFQDHHLLPQCTVLENVLVPTLVAPPSPDIEDWARELLDRVGLAARVDHRPAELSGGERQRTAIARALVLRPGLLLCDEPTGNLDTATAERVAELVLGLQADTGSTLVVVTHSMTLADRFRRRLDLHDGKAVEVSS